MRVSPRPYEPDVRLSIFLHGDRFDFIACRTAAELFVHEWHPGTATIVPGTAPNLPRLPNERLYLHP